MTRLDIRSQHVLTSHKNNQEVTYVDMPICMQMLVYDGIWVFCLLFGYRS